jgi:hypothetical protein
MFYTAWGEIIDTFTTTDNNSITNTIESFTTIVGPTKISEPPIIKKSIIIPCNIDYNYIVDEYEKTYNNISSNISPINIASVNTNIKKTINDKVLQIINCIQNNSQFTIELFITIINQIKNEGTINIDSKLPPDFDIIILDILANSFINLYNTYNKLSISKKTIQIKNNMLEYAYRVVSILSNIILIINNKESNTFRNNFLLYYKKYKIEPLINLINNYNNKLI